MTPNPRESRADRSCYVGQAALAMALLLGAACSGCFNGPDASGGEGGEGVLASTEDIFVEAEASNLAVLTVRSSLQGPADRRHYQIYATAHFARFQGLARERVLRILGETDYISDEATLGAIPVGTCRVESQRLSEAYPPDDGLVDVELLDAGLVVVELGEPVTLRGEQYPELVNYMAGMRYEGTTRRRTWPYMRKGSGIARFRASGSFDIEPFSVGVQAPRPIRIVEIGGRAALDGVTSVRSGRDLTVSWEPTGGPSNILVLEVVRQGYDASASLRCSVEDTGSFVLNAEDLAALPSLPGEVTDRLLLSRITMTSFSTDSLADGLAIFISEDNVLLR